MRWAPALLAAVLIGTAACSDQAANTGTPDPRWSAMVATLSGPFDPSSANVCNRGDTGCIPIVEAEMQRRLAPLARTCSHEAPFALMYLRVTEAVARSGRGQFANPSYIAHLDALFARSYFIATDNWVGGHRDRVPEAWRIAFQAADDRTVSGIGDMLLGMNAHISRDLPFAVAAAWPELSQAAGRKADFDRVNSILTQVQGPLTAEAARRWDPTIATFRIPDLGQTDGIGTIIGRWRNEAWNNGKRLAGAKDARDRARIAADIESTAANRALLIRAATGYLDLRSDPGVRDRYCRGST
ncbi:MAG: DUF5995 family protein [Jatrophihabitans sp.]